MPGSGVHPPVLHPSLKSIKNQCILSPSLSFLNCQMVIIMFVTGLLRGENEIINRECFVNHEAGGELLHFTPKGMNVLEFYFTVDLAPAPG